MFRRKTVLIVGAGASKELGLPTGAELSKQIAEMCNVGINGFGEGVNVTSQRVLDDLRRWSKDDVPKINRLLSAMKEIQNALPFKDSIDAVIDQYHDWPEVAEVGKYMIARLIMKAEAGSYLGLPFGTSGGANLVLGTWLHSFVRMLFEGLRRDQLGSVGDNISIICFNYDRCIEAYLAYALAVAYNLKKEEAVDFANRVKIIHSYGSLGALPGWQSESASSSIGFGESAFDPWRVATNLKTFSESVDGDTDDQIKSLIQGGNQYIYLGLSYGRQNMELLTAKSREKSEDHERGAYASGMGQSQQSQGTICELIRNTYGGRRYVRPSTPPSTHLELGSTAKEVLDLRWHNILR